jgi:hypothetical protein
VNCSFLVASQNIPFNCLYTSALPNTVFAENPHTTLPTFQAALNGSAAKCISQLVTSASLASIFPVFVFFISAAALAFSTRGDNVDALRAVLLISLIFLPV